MNELRVLGKVFEGKGITTLQWSGQPPFWVAKELGQALGYAGGGEGLTDLLRREWADEFIEGHDYALLKGQPLAELKKVLARNPGITRAVEPNVNQLLVLYQSGIDGVALKTDKPEGKRFRRWLRDEVFPELRRTGRYQSKPAATKEALGTKEVFEEYRPAVLAAIARKAAEGNLQAARMYLSLGASSQKNTGPTRTSQIESLLRFGAKPAELIQEGFSKTLVYAVFARLRAQTPADN